MQNILTKGGLSLKPGAVASLKFKRPVCLRITAGHVWVTIEGGHTDYWLSAGHNLDIAGQALVVIESVRQASQVQVCQCRLHWRTRAVLALRWLIGLRLGSADDSRWRTCC